MKRILLFSLVIACALLTKAQTANFDNAFPEGWIVNQDLRIAAYKVPGSAKCGNDVGMVTPEIDRAGSIHLGTSGAASFPASLTSLTINFDFYAFNANAPIACAAPQNLKCETSINAYLVPASYTSDKTPAESMVYGKGTLKVNAFTTNSLTINITKTLDASARYRLFVEGSTSNCSGNGENQVYVIDNLSVVGGESQNFNNALPAGWMFNPDFTVGAYKTSKCADNLGLITPPVATNGSIHLATSPATQYSPTTGSFNVRFDLAAYAMNKFNHSLACANADKTLNCATSIKIYVVDGGYDKTVAPTGNEILGQSIVKNVVIGANNISVPVTGNLDPSKRYRLFIEGMSSGCSLSIKTQAYVIDNIRIVEIERSILPVTFKSFTANRSNSNAVALTWETAMEENNRGFHVQRNIDGNWKNVAFVFSQAEGGNSSAILRYSFNDVNPSRGVSQYRLLQVDYNNAGKYSEIRSVRGEGQASKVLVYPNPSHTGSVSVMFDDASSVRDVIVSDVTGRVVKQFRAVSNNSLVIENLVDGYYTVQITNHTTAATTVEKVIIKKR